MDRISYSFSIFLLHLPEPPFWRGLIRLSEGSLLRSVHGIQGAGFCGLYPRLLRFHGVPVLCYWLRAGIRVISLRIHDLWLCLCGCGYMVTFTSISFRRRMPSFKIICCALPSRLLVSLREADIFVTSSLLLSVSFTSYCLSS